MATSFEALEGEIVNVRVIRTGGSRGTASVDYATMDGTAVEGQDFTTASGTLVWPDGLSGNQTISIPILDDDTAEPSESFAVRLSNASVASLGTNTSAAVDIVDDD